MSLSSSKQKPTLKTNRRKPVESKEALKQRTSKIQAKLERAFPDSRMELDYRTPLQLLVATILSAQCTDERVNQVTPRLFRRYSLADDYAKADPAELEEIIRPTGFYKNKARSLIACGKALVERFNGRVPNTLEDLVTLPGVGRKTANVILGNCFGKPAVVVDTHVKRVAWRLGLTTSDDPDKIEQDLQRIIPQPLWTSSSHRLLLHGRYICVAKRPKCEQCPVYEECPWEGKYPR
ncbi:MAG: endonuclease III [Nitrospiraceae bacterium]